MLKVTTLEWLFTMCQWQKCSYISFIDEKLYKSIDMLNLQKDKQKESEWIWTTVCWFKILCHSPKLNWDRDQKWKAEDCEVALWETFVSSFLLTSDDSISACHICEASPTRWELSGRPVLLPYF